MTYYDELDIRQDASEVEIKRAYRRQMLAFHPDNYHGDAAYASEKISRVQEAYAVLSDERQRRQYDLELASEEEEPEIEYFNAEDFCDEEEYWNVWTRRGKRQADKYENVGRSSRFGTSKRTKDKSNARGSWTSNRTDTGSDEYATLHYEDDEEQDRKGLKHYDPSQRRNRRNEHVSKREERLRMLYMTIITSIIVVAAMIGVFFLGKYTGREPSDLVTLAQNAPQYIVVHTMGSGMR